jgi:nicotinate-nucleotide adenylyltransferase
MKHIAVYSGSFNPLHIGHLAIMKHMIGEEGFDNVYLIVSPKNPLKDGISSGSGRERYEAAVKAVQRRFPGQECRVTVDDIELNMPEPHYTIRTLDSLREREPSNSFTLIIGGDNLADIRRWKDYTRILKEYGVAVFPRTGFDSEAIKADLLAEDPSYRIRLTDAEMVDMSSTTIREALEKGQDVSEWLM